MEAHWQVQTLKVLEKLYMYIVWHDKQKVHI